MNETPHKGALSWWMIKDDWPLGIQVQLKYAHRMRFIGYQNPYQKNGRPTGRQLCVLDVFHSITWLNACEWSNQAVDAWTYHWPKPHGFLSMIPTGMSLCATRGTISDDRARIPFESEWGQLAASSFRAFNVEMSCENSSNCVFLTQNISTSVNFFTYRWSSLCHSQLNQM